MFSVSQVLVSTIVGTLASLGSLYVAGRYWWHEPIDLPGALAASLLVGLSILAWRLVANVPQLNDDLIPVMSPNDVLCPVITYVVLGVSAGVRRPGGTSSSQRERALLTIASLLVNVVTL